MTPSATDHLAIVFVSHPSRGFLNGKSNKTKYSFLTRSKSGRSRTTSWDHKKLTQINETNPRQKKDTQIQKCEKLRVFEIGDWKFSEWGYLKEMTFLFGEGWRTLRNSENILKLQKDKNESTWLIKWNWEGAKWMSDSVSWQINQIITH